MRNFSKWLQTQLDELDVLETIYLELDDPGDTVEWIVRQASDRACRLGLADLYKQSLGIRQNSLKEARWYLSQCLAATHEPRQELPDGDAYQPTEAASCGDMTHARQTILLDHPLSVPEVAKFLRVRPDKVLSWIRSGRLRGYNVAERENGRPKYRVNPDDLEAFMQQRAITQPAPKGRPPGRRRIPKVPLALPSL